MFQTFEASTSPEQGPPRLAALRRVMRDTGLDGFFVPRADAHQGEYVAPSDERLAWLTGFTGSAGFCIALADRAGVFIDGRYRLQVKDQVSDAFAPVPWPETSPQDWLKQALPNGGQVGFDPWLHTPGQISALETALDGTGITLVKTGNLIDAIWPDRPEGPREKISAYPVENAGETADSKRLRIAEVLAQAGQKAAVITLPDSICWLLNIRGTDIVRNPVAQAFCILHADGHVDLFTDASNKGELADHLGGDVTLHAKVDFIQTLPPLTGPVRVDRNSAPQAVADALAQPVWGDDPCILPKARKNAAEIAGARAAHHRDACAMVEFLAWLDEAAPKTTLTEIDIVSRLEGFRRATNALRDISFETIAGSGPNGAIVHYRVTHQTNRTLRDGELLLVDSGGQYEDGTTDITRTIAIGAPGETERACYTRVLQGMIAMSRAQWPAGRDGRELDAIARYPLWQAGLDYDHGTGHGVGAYLSVHEGPQRLARAGTVPLEAGMILSNEPGYYREGAFGIRLENLIVVQPAEMPEGADKRDMLSFETLTFVPFDRRLIAAEMLSASERAWLNGYHQSVADRLQHNISDKARHWLFAATAPI